MDAKKIIAMIIAVCVLVGIGYFIGYNQFKNKALLTSQEYSGVEKLQKVDALFSSKLVHSKFFLGGTVQKIEGRKLTVMVYNDKGEKLSLFTLPISDGAEIVLGYRLTADIPEADRRNLIRTPEGQEYYIGEKKISFEDIRKGDNAFIELRLNNDYDIEGIHVRIDRIDLRPAALLMELPEKPGLSGKVSDASEE